MIEHFVWMEYLRFSSWSACRYLMREIDRSVFSGGLMVDRFQPAKICIPVILIGFSGAIGFG